VRILKPKVFIGSSSQSLPIATALGQQLKKQAGVEVRLWNESFFNLNRGILEDLLNQLEEFDFAVLVLAPDDVTIVNDQLSFSTRDNVLFELGLFMGRLGRDRVFVACDNRIDLRTPSDLLGVTLALYDGSLIGESTPTQVIREASHRIAEEIKKPILDHIVGEWRSKYRLTAEPNHPLAEEDVDVTANKAGLCITNKNNSQNDYYIARANLTEQGLFLGKWRAIATKGSTNGVFLLTADPRGKVMYGYATGLDERSGTIYGTWVLAKKDGADELEIARRLQRGEELLRSTILTWQLPDV
jgi:GGDEF domain-containing protein